MHPEIQDAVNHLLAALRDLRQLTDRRFTLDGFALGDLGETVASLWYGVKLHPTQSHKGQDGTARDGRSVEVKITQGNAVALAAHDHVPDHLLVFHLDIETGKVKTVYNGPAAPAWEKAGKPNSRRQRRLSFAALRKIPVVESERLPRVDTVTARPSEPVPTPPPPSASPPPRSPGPRHIPGTFSPGPWPPPPSSLSRRRS